MCVCVHFFYQDFLTGYEKASTFKEEEPLQWLVNAPQIFVNIRTNGNKLKGNGLTAMTPKAAILLLS